MKERKITKSATSPSGGSGTSGDGCSGSIGMSTKAKSARASLDTDAVAGKDGLSSYKLESFSEAVKPVNMTNVKSVSENVNGKKKKVGLPENWLYSAESFGFNRFFSLSVGVAVLSMIFFGLFPQLKLREGHS